MNHNGLTDCKESAKYFRGTLWLHGFQGLDWPRLMQEPCARRSLIRLAHYAIDPQDAAGHTNSSMTEGQLSLDMVESRERPKVKTLLLLTGDTDSDTNQTRAWLDSDLDPWVNV